MNDQATISGYRFSDAKQSPSHTYLLPALKAELNLIRSMNPEIGSRCFDLGCGNGSIAASLAESYWDVTGVDPSIEGVAAAAETFPHLRIEVGSAYDDLVHRFGQFPIVVSLEVVEHV